MFLKELKLENFRNLENLELNFDKKINIFVGNNAQGKTNILESIYFLAITKSHRTRNELNLIKADKKSVAEVLIIPMLEDLSTPIKIANDLRENGINTEIFLNDKKLKAKMKYADKLEIPYVIVVGEDEVKSDVVKIKNMKTGYETECQIHNISHVIRLFIGNN